MVSCVQGFANILSDEVNSLGITAEVVDMKDYDPDDQLADEVKKCKIISKEVLNGTETVYCCDVRFVHSSPL